MTLGRITIHRCITGDRGVEPVRVSAHRANVRSLSVHALLLLTDFETVQTP